VNFTTLPPHHLNFFPFCAETAGYNEPKNVKKVSLFLTASCVFVRTRTKTPLPQKWGVIQTRNSSNVGSNTSQKGKKCDRLLFDIGYYPFGRRGVGSMIDSSSNPHEPQNKSKMFYLCKRIKRG
jgi:hypothetical protein